MQYRCSVVQCILHLYCSQNSVAAVHTAHAVYKYTAYILQGNCSTLVVYTAESVRCTSSVYCIYTAFRSGYLSFTNACTLLRMKMKWNFVSLLGRKLADIVPSGASLKDKKLSISCNVCIVKGTQYSFRTALGSTLKPLDFIK